MNIKQIIKILFYNISLILIFFFLIDITFFLFGVSDKFIKPFYGYETYGRATYPRNYFEKNSFRGFDIKPNSHAIYKSNLGKLEIFSNKYGCFDHLEEYNDYILLLGDSFAWGYEYYENTLGYVLEKHSGTEVAKCGVTNTGQRFQLNKLKFLLKNISKKPKYLIVGHFQNDISNDIVFPQSTVLDGWLVDYKKLTNNEIVTLSENDLIRDYNIFLDELDKKNKKLIYKIKKSYVYEKLRENSVSFNVLIEIFKKFNIIRHNLIKSKIEIKNNSEKKITKKYTVSKPNYCGYQNYNSKHCLNPNRNAILKIIEFSKSNNIPLIFIIFPVKNLINDPYKNFRFFLTTNNIKYLDVHNLFKEYDKKLISNFFQSDGHLNKMGNKLVVDKLLIKIQGYDE